MYLSRAARDCCARRRPPRISPRASSSTNDWGGRRPGQCPAGWRRPTAVELQRPATECRPLYRRWRAVRWFVHVPAHYAAPVQAPRAAARRPLAPSLHGGGPPVRDSDSLERLDLTVHLGPALLRRTE